MVLRTAAWWWNAEPYVSEPELVAAETAARVVETLPAGAQLVFVVHEPDRALVLPSQVLNTIRTVLPPDRGEDVRVYFGPPGDVFARRPSSNDPVIRALQQRVVNTLGQDDPVVFVLRPFDDQLAAFTDPRLHPLSSDVAVSTAPATPPAPYVGVQRTSRGGIALALLFIVAMLCAAGLGWSLSLRRDGFETAALTPACGLGALVVASIIVDRLGLPLSGSAGPTVVVALAAVPGYLLAFRPGRRSQPAAPQPIRR